MKKARSDASTQPRRAVSTTLSEGESLRSEGKALYGDDIVGLSRGLVDAISKRCLQRLKSDSGRRPVQKAKPKAVKDVAPRT